MGIRRAKKHNDGLRRSIDGSLMIDHLTSCVTGGADYSPQRVRAAEILLRKILPDLQSMSVDTGPAGITVVLKQFSAP